MHQSHNIPWASLASCLKVKEDNPYLEGRHGTNIFRNAVNIVPRNLPSQKHVLEDFVKRFIASLNDFTNTERAKYASKPRPLKAHEKVYSDDFLNHISTTYSGKDEWTGGINTETQLVSTWLRRCPERRKPSDRYWYRGASQGPAETVNNALMIIVDEADDFRELDGLIAMAHHPTCDISSLESFSAHADPGWGNGVAEALNFYIMLNVLGNMPEALKADSTSVPGQTHGIIVSEHEDRILSANEGFNPAYVPNRSEKYLRFRPYYQGAGNTKSWNFEAPDRLLADDFWKNIPVVLPEQGLSPEGTTTGSADDKEIIGIRPMAERNGNRIYRYDRTGLPGVFDDLEAVHRQLKKQWRRLYRYNMLLRECNIDHYWEGAIISQICDLFGFAKETIYETDPSNGSSTETTRFK